MSKNFNDARFIHSIFESLEERVLFDGVPDATFILPQADAGEPMPEQVQSLEQADIQAPRELILIDAGVENSEQLLTEILESKPNSALEIRILDPNSNGVDQISAILAESEGEFLPPAIKSITKTPRPFSSGNSNFLRLRIAGSAS